jgi:hypothetical protein
MNNGSHKPAIWADAMRLLVEIEQAVRSFSRYHKYTLGSDLRGQAALVCRRVAHAARFPEQRLASVQALVVAVEDLKISIQLAKEVQAFASFAQFQRIVELAVQVGKQSGGWWKQVRSAASRADAPASVREA